MFNHHIQGLFPSWFVRQKENVLFLSLLLDLRLLSLLYFILYFTLCIFFPFGSRAALGQRKKELAHHTKRQPTSGRGAATILPILRQYLGRSAQSGRCGSSFSTLAGRRLLFDPPPWGCLVNLRFLPASDDGDNASRHNFRSACINEQRLRPNTNQANRRLFPRRRSRNGRRKFLIVCV